jgi:SAM-dependent methyltransferase
MSLQGTAAPTAPQATQDWDQTASVWGDIVGHEKDQILGPALVAKMKGIQVSGAFDIVHSRALDWGCGFGSLMASLLRAGFKTDGYDTSPAMVAAARNTLTNAQGHLSAVSGFVPTITNNLVELPQATYKMALLSFVHQCAPNKTALKNVLNDVGSYVEPCGHLIMIGAHPHKRNLSQPHSSCEYDWPKRRNLNDGDKYSGRIFNGDGAKVVDLVAERYWSLRTLKATLRRVGFGDITIQPIADVASKGRPASTTAPFFMLTAVKTRQ